MGDTLSLQKGSGLKPWCRYRDLRIRSNTIEERWGIKDKIIFDAIVFCRGWLDLQRVWLDLGKVQMRVNDATKLLTNFKFINKFISHFWENVHEAASQTGRPKALSIEWSNFSRSLQASCLSCLICSWSEICIIASSDGFLRYHCFLFVVNWEPLVGELSFDDGLWPLTLQGQSAFSKVFFQGFLCCLQ